MNLPIKLSHPSKHEFEFFCLEVRKGLTPILGYATHPYSFLVNSFPHIFPFDPPDEKQDLITAIINTRDYVPGYTYSSNCDCLEYIPASSMQIANDKTNAMPFFSSDH
ncbi:unnamed protein product [Allacma fusca]|uniref:Uncharacterized protein n=1 Tax=Allacma fusca TaxID=39272 RepID=A0A8J2PUA9_9HEXA|nr:unnamed protein product [Allacma fusca]